MTKTVCAETIADVFDETTPLTFGKHKGLAAKQVATLYPSYVSWILNNIIETSALMSYFQRCADATKIHYKPVGRSVTALCKLMGNSVEGVPSYVPELLLTSTKLPTLSRPANLHPSLYGLFIDYLIRLWLTTRDDPLKKFYDRKAEQVVNNHCKAYPKAELYFRIKDSYEASLKTPLDALFISFAHTVCYSRSECISMMDFRNMHDHVNVEEKLYQGARESILESYKNTPIVEMNPDICTCSLRADLDLLLCGDTTSPLEIVDIKCCANIDKKYFRLQLFAYSALVYAKYGKTVSCASIYNYHDGSVLKMDLSCLAPSCYDEFLSYMIDGT